MLMVGRAKKLTCTSVEFRLSLKTYERMAFRETVEEPLFLSLFSLTEPIVVVAPREEQAEQRLSKTSAWLERGTIPRCTILTLLAKKLPKRKGFSGRQGGL